ncbi:MAG TPA: UPF0262 family protein [Acetobacteraceae bacterium]
MSGGPESRIARVELDGEPLSRLSPLMEADRTQAVADLASENRFMPLLQQWGPPAGPFALHLSIQEGRLVFDIRNADGTKLGAIGIALGPFRSLMKDYRLLVESHVMAVQEGREARIQAIDMGRRGLHNEGASLLMQRLAGKVELDLPTARRLFTLMCVLHQRI